MTLSDSSCPSSHNWPCRVVEASAVTPEDSTATSCVDGAVEPIPCATDVAKLDVAVTSFVSCSFRSVPTTIVGSVVGSGIATGIIVIWTPVVSINCYMVPAVTVSGVTAVMNSGVLVPPVAMFTHSAKNCSAVGISGTGFRLVTSSCLGET